VATPKYYVWLVASEGEAILSQGAARVAEVESNQFTVLNFLSQADIWADPEALGRVFPAVLVPAIQARAGLVES
jgi:hypothetical protein